MAAESDRPSPTGDKGTPYKDKVKVAKADADTLARSYKGRPVTMVAQPAVETIRVRGEANEDPPRVWMKAKVLVATAQRARAPKPIVTSRTLALSPSTGRSLGNTPSSATSHDTPRGDAALPTPNQPQKSSASTGSAGNGQDITTPKSTTMTEPRLPSTVYSGEPRVMSA